MYGCEAWTITKDMETKIQATQMCFLRKMMKISLTDRVSFAARRNTEENYENEKKKSSALPQTRGATPTTGKFLGDGESGGKERQRKT